MGGSRTKRPATGRCGLHLPSPLPGAAPNRPRGFATEGRSFQLLAVSCPTALTRGHRPWVKAAQNARQLEVAGFICQAPLRGLRLTAARGFATEGRSFQLLAVSGPPPLAAAPATRGWEMHEFARHLDVAGFICKAS